MCIPLLYFKPPQFIQKYFSHSNIYSDKLSGVIWLKQTSRSLVKLVCYIACVLVEMSLAQATDFTHHGRIGNGWQFDAAIDASGIVHLISDQYYQFDLSGKLITADREAQDLQQFALAFPPAISLDPSGNTHILIRGTGTFSDGMEIYYRVRNSDGSWQDDTRYYQVGTPQSRNYVLGLAAVSETEVYAHHGAGGSNVWGDISFWNLGDQAAQGISSWPGIWRSDLDTRMRAYNGKIYFASANAFIEKDVFFSIAVAGPEWLNDLKRNVHAHHAGASDKRGNPDIGIDKSGAAHLVYGAYQEVYYNQYKSNGVKVYPSDQRILSELGTWHLSFGMSAVGVSDDGSKILVLGLKTNNDKLANNAQIVLTYSLDAGKTWSEQIETGQYSHGGEGRMRPRLLAHDDQFVIIYFDATKQGLSMATINMDSLENLNPGSALSAIPLLLLD